MFDKIDHLHKLVALVIRRQQFSLIVTGKPGTGKSTAVIDQLVEDGQEENQDYHLIKGYSTVKAIYQALYDHNGGILVFDDCDSVLRNRDGLNVLKAALESKESRKISWLSTSKTFNPSDMTNREINGMIRTTGKYPNTFTFWGVIVFVSNCPMASIDEALRSRSISIDVSPSYLDIIGGIRERIDTIEPKIVRSVKEEVLDFFTQNQSRNSDFNLRTYLHGLSFRISQPEHWKELMVYA